MDNSLLAWSVTAFVFMGAIAMIIQAVASVRMFRAVRDIKMQVSPLIPQVVATLDSARATIEESRTQIADISTRTKAILDSTRVQLTRIEDVVSDASTRAKRQLERTELVVEDTVARVHESVSAVQGAVMRPIREVNGLAAGVKAGVRHLMKGKRPDIDRATQDEEMFI